jgi:hypothetical protein
MANDIAPVETEISAEVCPQCGGIIKVLWAVSGANGVGGVISDPAYVLVADWVMHTVCWDALVERLPPWHPPERDYSGDFESWGDDS